MTTRFARHPTAPGLAPSPPTWPGLTPAERRREDAHQSRAMPSPGCLAVLHGRSPAARRPSLRASPGAPESGRHGTDAAMVAPARQADRGVVLNPSAGGFAARRTVDLLSRTLSPGHCRH